MPLSFEPNLIRRDSTVPIRLVAMGWALGVIVSVVDDPFDGRIRSLIAFTLLAAGLIAAMLNTPRTMRMVSGAVAGSLATWMGYRYAVADRLVPAVEEDPMEVFDRTRAFAVLGGLAVFAIGAGGLLEALRAQSQPGNSPLAVKLLLLAYGMVLAYLICRYADVSGNVTILATLAVGAALAAMAWLRVERSPDEYQPTP